MGESWRSTFFKTLRWSAYLAGHGVVAAGFIMISHLLQILLKWVGDPKLFDHIPLRYLFDVMELGILSVFLVSSLREAILVFREHDDA